MNSKDLWETLERSNTKDILIMLNGVILYLTKNRGVEFKDTLKDIKAIHKKMGV